MKIRQLYQRLLVVLADLLSDPEDIELQIERNKLKMLMRWYYERRLRKNKRKRE